MGKNKSTKFFQGKEAFQRMNFLYQASELLMSRMNQPSLAAYYGSQMTSICKKSVLRMEPSVKRQLCKGCRALLVPGISSRFRTNTSSKNLVITCLQCGTLKRFPMKPGYRVWVDTPEACVETLSTGVADQIKSTKCEKSQNQPKEQKGKKDITHASTSAETPKSNSQEEQCNKMAVQCGGKSCIQETNEVLSSNKPDVNMPQNEIVCLKSRNEMEMTD